MAIGNRKASALDMIECHSCMDDIDWDATSKALGKSVSRTSYIENPNAEESLQFVSSDGSPLTLFTLQMPPAKLFDLARDGREASLSRQAFYLGLRCIRRIQFLYPEEEEHAIKTQDAPHRERLYGRGKNYEVWNRVICEELQNALGNTIITEMGYIVMDREEKGESENF